MTNDEHNGRQSENFDRRPEEHLDEADLILYLDKELGREESARIHSHLEWCVPCRGVRDALDTASTEFATVQRELDEALPPPPRNWASFDARLAGVLEEGSPVAAARSNRIGDAWRKWRRSVPILPWGFATAAAGLLVGYLWFHSAPHAALSFAAIADRVEQHAGPSSMNHPVVYRKLRISVSTAPDLTLTVELWKRGTDGRVVEVEARQPAGGLQKAAPNRGASLPASGAYQIIASHSNPGLLAQVHELYQANDLDWNEPLSAGKFKDWADSHGPQIEQVVHERLPDDSAGYRLVARSRTPLTSPTHDVVSELQLLVRASDWHAIAERLTVQSRSGVRTYEVAELEYREVPLSDVPGFVFGATSAVKAMAGDLPHPALGVQPLSGTALSMEVLKRLDALDALVKDQVQFTRVGQEGLKVAGTLASDQRKTEILAALGPLASNPALEIDLLSPAEARDRAFHSTSRPTQIQSVQVPSAAQASNTYLRKWLAEHRGLSGAQLDSEVERFQMGAMVLSSDAQLQAQALSRILDVAPAEPADLAAGETWNHLVNRHAAAAREQIRALEQHLAPVFRTDPVPLAGDHSGRDKAGDVRSQATGLLDLLTASDHQLWQAFSNKAPDSDQSQLTDPKFWLMLEEEDSLAEHMMRRGRP